MPCAPASPSASIRNGLLLHSTSVTESAEIIAMSHATWPDETNRALLLSEFDERFRRYRLSVPEAERALVDSLKRYGQMA